MLTLPELAGCPPRATQKVFILTVSVLSLRFSQANSLPLELNGGIMRTVNYMLARDFIVSLLHGYRYPSYYYTG